MKLFLLVVLAVFPFFALATSSNPFVFQDAKKDQAQLTDKKPSEDKERLNLAVAAIGVASVSQNIVYKYDELGRLVCVQDEFAGNRKFEYDSAGNRTNVTVVKCD